MKATELRIGNLVNYNEDPFKVRMLRGREYEDWDPIPLTEEWLLKFGFIEDDHGFSKSAGRKIFMVLSAQDEEDYLVFFKPDIGMEYCEIAFNPPVHTLQNLYFDLMEEEL